MMVLLELLLVATAVYWGRFPEDPFVPSLLVGAVTGALVAVFLVVLGVRWLRRRAPLGLGRLPATLSFVAVSGATCLQAISTLPHRLNNGTVPQENIGNFPDLYWFFIALHLLATVALLWAHLRGRKPARTGLWLLAGLWTLNGQFFHQMIYYYHLEDYARLPYAPYLLLGLGLCVFLRAARGRALARRPGASTVLLLGFLGVAVVAALRSRYPHGSLWYVSWLLNGALVYWAFRLEYDGDPRVVRRFLHLPVACAAVVSLLALVRMAGIAWVLGPAQLRSLQAMLPAIHYNALALYLLISVGIGLGLELEAPPGVGRRALRAATLLNVLVLGLTRSKSGLLGLAVLLVGYALVRTRRSGRGVGALHPGLRRKVLPALLVIVALVGITGFQKSFRTRRSLWAVVLRVIAAHPLSGVGPGIHYLQPAFVDIEQSDTINSIRLFLAVHAHNLFLEVAKGSGLPGLAVFLGFLAALGLRVWRRRERGGPLPSVLAITGLAFLAASLSALSLSIHTLLPMEWWLLLGALLAGLGPAPPPSRSRLRDPLLVCLLLPVLLLAVTRPLILEHWFRQVNAMKETWLEDPRPALLARIEAWDPFNAKLPEWQGRLAVERRDRGAALSAYGRAARLRRDFPPYEHRLGLLDWLRQEYERAEQHLEAAARGDPGGVYLPRSLFDLALLEAFLGRDAEAVTAFARDLRLRFVGAEQLYLRYFARTPLSIQPIYVLKPEFRPGPMTFSLTQEIWTMLLGDEDQTEHPPEGRLRPRRDFLTLDMIADELERQLAEGRFGPGERSWIIRKLGELQEIQGRFGAARRWYGKLLEFPLRRDYAHYLLGHIETRMGNLVEAEQNLRRSHYWEELGEFLVARGRLAEAVEVWQRQPPQLGIYGSFHKEPYWRLGDLYAELGRWEKALACYRKSLFTIRTVDTLVRIGELARRVVEQGRARGIPPAVLAGAPFVQEGIDALREAIEVYEELGEDQPEKLARIRGLLSMLTGLGRNAPAPGRLQPLQAAP